MDEPDDLSAHPSQDSFLAKLALPVRAAPSLPPGTVLDGKYVVQGVIGAGGMGEVYLARDRSLGREVAIKRHRGDRDVERLRREAQAMAKLTHPNVVTVHEVGPLEDGLFVAMEYVPGTTLRGHLAAARPRARQLMALLRMAGEGLAAAHAAGIVHRDFKPENVLVGRDGRARVSDFGLARQSSMDDLTTLPVDSGDTLRASLALTETLPAAGAGATLPGTVMGTPAYMAPEQARGEPADARADQYAFCVVAWEALLGERPGPRLAAAPTGWPLSRVRHWRRVLERGLAAEPGARYPSLRALLDALDEHRWWRGPALVGGAAAAVAALAWWQLAPAPLSCEAAGRELDEEPVLQRAASGTGPAAAVVARWKRDYRSAAQAACQARVQRAWEPTLLRRAELCLHVQRRTGVALLDGPSGGRGADADAERALRALQLPAPRDCSTPARLLGGPRPPEDPAHEAAAVTERARLAAGEITGEPPTAAGAPWNEARRALATARRAPSRTRTEALEAARARALALGDAEAALGADAALLAQQAERTRDVGALARGLRQAAEDGERLGAAAPEAAAALYLAAAEAELARRELTPRGGGATTRTEEQAAAWVAKALVLVPSSPSRLHLEVLMRRGELQLAMGRLVDARADLAAAQREATELAGARGALAARVAARAAYLLVRAGQAADARPYLELATGAAQEPVATAVYPLLRREHVATREALGSLSLERGDLHRGVQWLGEAHGAALAPGARSSLTMALDLALAYFDLKRPAAAATLLTAELAAQRAELGEDHADLGLLHYNLSIAQRDARQLELAAGHAARAIEQFSRAGDLDLSRLALALAAGIATDRGRPQDALLLTGPLLVGEQSAVDPQALAWPRLEHARALIALRARSRQARQLLLEARQIYELYGSHPQLTRIEALLRELAGAR